MNILPELGKIAAAKYGLQLKEPIFIALDKLAQDSKFELIDDDIYDINEYLDTLFTENTVTGIIKLFLQIYYTINGRIGLSARVENPTDQESMSYWVNMLAEELVHSSNGYSNSLPITGDGIVNGIRMRAAMYHILDILQYQNSISEQNPVVKGGEPMYVYGRDISSFVVYGNSTGVGETIYGLSGYYVSIKITDLLDDELSYQNVTGSVGESKLYEGDSAIVGVPSSVVTPSSLYKIEVERFVTEMEATYKIAKDNSELNTIILDVTRFSAANPKLYSTRGSEIGEVSMISGVLAENVYTTETGLHVTGYTKAKIPVSLSKTSPWTIDYEFDTYTTNNRINALDWIFSSDNQTLQTCKITYGYNDHAIHTLLKGDKDYTTLYNYCYFSNDANGFYDNATETQMMYGFKWHYRWINDGEYLSLWVNGIKKASIASEALTADAIAELDIPNAGMDVGGTSNDNHLNVTGFKIKSYADTTNDRVLYKWHITKFKAYEDWFTVKRFKLYTANDALIDQNEDNYVCIFTNNDSSQDGIKNNKSLAYSLLAKAQSDGVYHDHGYIYRPNHTVDGDVIDVIYSVPSSLPAVNAYSYVAPFDGGNIFDFTAWANVVKTYTVQGTNGIRKGNGAWSDNEFTMTKGNISGWMSTLSTLNTLGDTSKVPTISLPYYASQNKPYVLRFHVTSNVVNPRITVLIKAGNTNTTISDTEPTIDVNGNAYVTFNTTERSISICFGANDFVQDNYATISDIVLTDETFSMRQPVSWTFQKSTDGGVTWTTLDTQADVTVPNRGQETQKFILS